MIRKEDIQDIYGLSPMQKSMLFHHALDPSSSAYTEQFDFEMRGHLEPERLQAALLRLSLRNEALRTVFSYRKTEQPRQVVLKSRPPEWTYRDLQDDPQPKRSLEAFKEADRSRGFDLSKEVLIRGALFRMGADQWNFILSFHHILMDGWSLGPLFRELFELYDSLALPDGLADDFPENQGHVPAFRDYIQWLEQKDESEARSYFRDYLDGYEQKAAVSGEDGSSSNEYGKKDTYHHATHAFQVPEALADRMHQLARAREITPNAVFQAAWGVVLQKLNYTQDVVFGYVVSGRPPDLPGMETMKGLFINTLPLRIRAKEGDSFLSICEQVQRSVFLSSPYEYYPLYEIQGVSPLKNQLLDHVVAFENYPLAEKLQSLGADSEDTFWIERVEVFERSNYDFNIIVNPGERFVVTFIYNRNKYRKERMEVLQRSLIQLLESVCANPELPVEQLSMCSDADREHLLHVLNPARRSYPSEFTIDAAFRRAASLDPHHPALRFQGQSISYAELDAWSDRLAAMMSARGLGPDASAGILMPRSPELVACILAILKLGAAYVPLDLANSDDRLRFMIEDADLRLLCTREEYISRVPGDSPLLLLDKEHGEGAGKFAAAAASAPSSQAYIMYTSGSTGKPKGCKISHQNVINLVFAQEFIDFGAHQVILQAASPAFDVSTFEIWGSLLHGGTLVLPGEDDLLDAERLKRLLAEEKVQSMVLTSSLFNRLCDRDPGTFGALSNLIVGGEALSVPHIGKAMNANPGLRLINGYGPTENSFLSTTHSITRADLARERIPIGKPVENSRAYIVDKGMNLLPAGAIGELCVGGDGVGMGYHERPEQTAQQFLQDRFVPGGLMYRTGDLAQWLPDGTIDYLGRLDTQVKVRGYRVELGEIERALMRLPGLRQAAVQFRQVGMDRHVCAYYVSEGAPQVQQWRSLLKSMLPEYMIPVFFIRLDSLPLNVNGKIDYQALPEPEDARWNEPAPARPLSELEDLVASICASVLGMNKQGIQADDQLFEIGINSLNMITIQMHLKEALQRDIPLASLFEHATISGIAQYLQQSAREERVSKEAETARLEQERNTLLTTATLIRRMGDR